MEWDIDALLFSSSPKKTNNQKETDMLHEEKIHKKEHSDWFTRRSKFCYTDR